MEENEHKIVIGIDLGTTNACVAVYRNDKIETIINKQGEYVTPSWVSYKPNELVVGKTARGQAFRNMNGTLFGIKRIIGRKYDDPAVKKVIKNCKFKVRNFQGMPQIEIQQNKEKRFVYPEAVSAEILKEMKEISEAFLEVNEISDVVITVPAYFNDLQRQATKDAAKIAGLNVLRLINEPTAAAIAYIFDKPEKNERNILVYDLGGGTFDVSIVSLNDCNIQVRATRGDANLGGQDFDQNCIKHFLDIMEEKYGIDIQEALTLRLRRRLEDQVEKMKENLSSTVETSVELDNVYHEIDVYEDISRATFDDLNKDLYERTLQITKECIEEAELAKEDIDDVVLVGGSTRIPKVKTMLEEYFGKPVSRAINPDHAVAHGAGIMAANIKGLLPKAMQVLDVIPMSLGIETLTGEMNVLIKRNTQIPTSAKQTYTTGVEGQDEIRVTIYQGDHVLARENLELGEIILSNLPANPDVEITFQVDVNGILLVSAVEVSTGMRRTLNVKLDKGRLTGKVIQNLKEQSDVLGEQRKTSNLLRDTRNRLEEHVLRMRNDLKNEYGISDNQKTAVLRTVKNFHIWLTSEDANDINEINKRFEMMNIVCETMLKVND